MEDQDLLAVTIGKNIMRLRRMANMTQLELAEKIKVPADTLEATVNRWNTDLKLPCLKTEDSP